LVKPFNVYIINVANIVKATNSSKEQLKADQASLQVKLVISKKGCNDELKLRSVFMNKMIFLEVLIS